MTKWSELSLSDKLFVTVSLGFLTLVILGIGIFVNYLLFRGVQYFFDTHIIFTSLTDAFLFSFGMVLFLIPGAVGGLLIEFIAIRISGYKRIFSLIFKSISSFLLVASYIFLVDKFLTGVVLSIYSVIGLSCAYMVLLNFIEWFEPKLDKKIKRLD